MSRTILLANARLADDRLVDVTVSADRRTVLDIVDASMADAGVGQQCDERRDLSGHVLLPRFHEPHAHLDKALSINSVDNPSGDLGGAITAWVAHRPTITHDDYVRRATAAVELYERAGVRVLRSHVDLGTDVGTSGLEALLEVKANVADRVEIQLVGLPVGLTGDNSEQIIKVCKRALALGLDMMGGVPHIEADPAMAIETILDLAGSHGCPVDIHADENLRADSNDLATLARAAIRTGFEPPLTASHCVALSMAAPQRQQEVSAVAAEANVAVVALPHTNLYLQAHDHPVAPPRGLTAVGELRRHGVTVLAGGDNLQDPFNPLGSGDPLETVALMVLAGHVSLVDAVSMVTVGNRAVVTEGDRADFVAIRGGSLSEVLAMRPTDRLLIKFDV